MRGAAGALPGCLSFCALCHSAQNGLLGFTSWADLVREKGRVERDDLQGNDPTRQCRCCGFGTMELLPSRPTELLAALDTPDAEMPIG